MQSKRPSTLCIPCGEDHHLELTTNVMKVICAKLEKDNPQLHLSADQEELSRVVDFYARYHLGDMGALRPLSQGDITHTQPEMIGLCDRFIQDHQLYNLTGDQLAHMINMQTALFAQIKLPHTVQQQSDSHAR